MFCATLLLVAALISGPAVAAEIGGRVVDAEGHPLSNVRMRITPRSAVPYSKTVFSTDDGTFKASYESASSSGLEIEAFRIGWKESARNVRKTTAGLSVDVTMGRVANVADQVPGSAWLKGDPNSKAYQLTVLQCSNCHQLGANRVRNFSAKMANLAVGDRAEHWVTRAADDMAAKKPGREWDKKADAPPAHGRVAGWEGVVQYMRLVTMRLGEPGKEHWRWGLKEGSPFFNALLQPDTSLFSPRDMAFIVPNLARNFPVVFDTYTDYDDVERLGEFGVNKDTVIDEYVLPTFGWTRELAIPPGSSKVWFIETDKDRVGSLDPKDGSVKWYPIPGPDPRKGPHGINADAKGNLWLALEDNFNVGRFDTKTEQWRLYQPPPETLFGVTHDFAFNSQRLVEPDKNGHIYLVDMGTNEVWDIDVESGKIVKFRQPNPQGETTFHTLLYGAAFDAQRQRVWWAQLHGNVGSFDAEKKVTDRVIQFEQGEGPRRLAIEDDGTLWVPLFGAGQIVRIEPESGLETGRFAIPDRGAGPYGVTYDKRRRAIWAATCNSDRIYRFDIDTQKWSHYPMPRKESYIRIIEVHPETGDIWTTYANLPVGKRDPKVYGIEAANNIIIRLHPGD